MLVYHKGTPVWLLHTGLYKKRTDFKLGEVTSSLISDNITISWLYLPNGFRIIYSVTVQAKNSFASFTLYGYITSSQCDQLADDLMAQLVEHCTGIAELMTTINMIKYAFFMSLQFNSKHRK